MKIIELIASKLGLLGIPVGRVAPHNLITDVCSSFVKADYLRSEGVEIDGQTMSTSEFMEAAEKYIGFDLVNEVLSTEVRDGINIHDHAILLIRQTFSKAVEYPEHYNKVIQDITSDISQAQLRLGKQEAAKTIRQTVAFLLRRSFRLHV